MGIVLAPPQDGAGSRGGGTMNEDTESGREDRDAPDVGEPASRKTRSDGGGPDGPDERPGRAGPFAELQEMVEDLVEGILQVAPGGAVRFPRVELVRTATEYWVMLDLPGVERADVELTTIGDELTVSGTRERPAYPDGARVRRSERHYGHFRRTLRLPGDADAGGIQARLASGVLHVRVPRRTGAATRRIDIEAP